MFLSKHCRRVRVSHIRDVHARFIQEPYVVISEDEEVYRPQGSEWERISDFETRKSILESPIIVKVVEDSGGITEKFRKEGIQFFNWFDLSLRDRILEYSRTGTLSPLSAPGSRCQNIELIRNRYLDLNFQLESDFRDLFDELNVGSLKSVEFLNFRTICIRNENSKFRVLRAILSFSVWKKLLFSTRYNNILILTDSPKDSKELAYILSKTYNDVRWNPKKCNSTPVFHKMYSNLRSAGYIVDAQNTLDISSKLLTTDVPIAIDFGYLDYGDKFYPEIPFRQKLFIRVGLPGYHEFRFLFNEASLIKGRLGDLLSSSKIVKVFIGEASRAATIFGLRILKDYYSLPANRFFDLEIGIRTFNHITYGDYLETRLSGVTKQYSSTEALENFILPSNFRDNSLRELIALYLYFSNKMLSPQMITLVEERSKIEYEHFLNSISASQKKLKFFKRYCQRTLHVQDLRPFSTSSSMEDCVRDFFKEVGFELFGLILRPPCGVVRLSDDVLKVQPFLSSSEIFLAREKYKLKISTIGDKKNLSSKSKRFVKPEEFFPYWLKHAKTLKSTGLFVKSSSKERNFFTGTK